jgi:hypothetical protein
MNQKKYNIFLTAIFIFIGFQSQAQEADRFLDFRGGDSVWVIKNSLISRSKYFIGSKQVNFATWENALQEGDLEISKFIKKGTGFRRTSTGIFFGGLTAITAGIIVQSNSNGSGNVNEQKRTIGRVTLGVGIAATGVALVLGQQGWAFYHKGMRLYNNKVLQPPKQPLSMHVLLGPAMVSLQIKW